MKADKGNWLVLCTSENRERLKKLIGKYNPRASFLTGGFYGLSNGAWRWFGMFTSHNPLPVIDIDEAEALYEEPKTHTCPYSADIVCGDDEGCTGCLKLRSGHSKPLWDVVEKELLAKDKRIAELERVLRATDNLLRLSSTRLAEVEKERDKYKNGFNVTGSALDDAIKERDELEKELNALKLSILNLNTTYNKNTNDNSTKP